MTVLSSWDIRNRIDAGSLVIRPFQPREEQTPPATVDLRLSATIISYEPKDGRYLIGMPIDEDEGKRQAVTEDEFWLEAGQSQVFVLHEEIRVPPDLAGIIVPRSSLTRLGLGFQSTYLNPGYSGTCPVLLINHTAFPVGIPFRNGIGPRVAQVLFLELSSQPHRQYGSHPWDKYYPDTGSPAKFHEDIDIIELIKPFKKILDRK